MKAVRATLMSILLLSPAVVAAQADANKSAAPSVAATASDTPGLQGRHPRYKLRRGDTFQLDFEKTPEFNQTVAVQPDGYISLKAVGSLFVEGETVPELTNTIEGTYATILHEPIIAISLQDVEKPYFIASGEVARPGKYDLRSDLTITEAVAIAGGFDEKSKHSQVILFRPVSSGGYEAKIVNVKKMLKSHNLSEDIRLQPGDLIYIPQNAFSKIRPFIPTSNMSAFVGQGVM